ncbi:MAG: XRE family transcriptional regulator [Eubacteriales bacterium]|nr:XRE family transcriptional regulator [Eubacteriales bacterium]
MALSDTLAALRKQKGLSQTQVAAFLSENGAPLTQKGVSKWERGDTTPSAAQFLLLCELYQVRDVLSVFLDQPNEEATLNASGQSRLREYLHMLLANEEFCEPRALPLYDMNTAYKAADLTHRAAAALLPASQAPQDAAFALRVRGESMSPLFEDGQIVYLQACASLCAGDFGAFFLNGALHCKLYMAAAGTELVSVNEKFPPIRVQPHDDFRILGKVIR